MSVKVKWKGATSNPISLKQGTDKGLNYQLPYAKDTTIQY
jgi:hypothetical protein